MAAGATPDDDRRFSDGQPGERSGASRAFWLVPALTFAVGLLLGALVVAAATSGDDADPPAQAVATPEPSPAAGGDLEIVVPASCLQAAEQADEVVEIMNRGVVAAGDLDAQAVQEALDELVDMRPTIEALIDQCREAAAAEVTN